MTPRTWWGFTIVSAISLTTYLAHALFAGDRRVFLPGDTSDGHHQIEARCELCHSESFSDADAIQEACVECHGAELRAVDDSHPRSKFTDPRNADRVAILDARYCATCHREHVPRTTHEMGLTLPRDYCFHCHQDIGTERPSHAALPYSSCADGGCHNFHDNKALYEDFLVMHADEPARLPAFRLPVRIPAATKASPLTLADVDAPDDPSWRPSLSGVKRWAGAVHARGGVNCSECHRSDGSWSVAVDPAVCGGCHEGELAGFGAGRHGMRHAAGLDPMRPDQARLPMQPEAKGAVLDCATCHGSHQFDTRSAATEACLGCHADRHSLAFEGSPHAGWRADLSDAEASATVTCATCHLPRLPHGKDGIRVEHNQNANLRPNEKMIREVCMNCHGLAFSLDALADRALIERNFRGQPSDHVSSVDWAIRREQSKSDPSEKEVSP